MSPLLLLLALLAAAGAFALGHARGVRRAGSRQVNARDAWLRVSPDAPLRAVAASVLADVRSCDVVGRLEGDRFGLLLPEADRARAEAVATRLHAQVAWLDVPSAGGAARVRSRVGIAGIGVDEVDVEVTHDLNWLVESALAAEALAAEALAAEALAGAVWAAEARPKRAPTPEAAALADVTEAA